MITDSVSKDIIVEYLKTFKYSCGDVANLLKIPKSTVIKTANKLIEPSLLKKIFDNSKVIQRLKLSSDKKSVLEQGHDYFNRECLNCNMKLLGHKKLYCSLKCQKELLLSRSYDDWLSGNKVFNTNFKKLVIKRDGYLCSECKINNWKGEKISLDLEHKNGISEDNSPTNLCLLCPNCHSQTSTYKAKNKGNGRHYRRERYKQGKSF